MSSVNCELSKLASEIFELVHKFEESNNYYITEINLSHYYPVDNDNNSMGNCLTAVSVK